MLSHHIYVDDRNTTLQRKSKGRISTPPILEADFTELLAQGLVFYHKSHLHSSHEFSVHDFRSYKLYLSSSEEGLKNSGLGRTRTLTSVNSCGCHRPYS